MEGALFDRASQFDVFFITLKKSERLFSAIGVRDIHYAVRGSRVTQPFLCLGLADYVSHEGERPLAIRWRLHRAIPAAFVPELALAV